MGELKLVFLIRRPELLASYTEAVTVLCKVVFPIVLSPEIILKGEWMDLERF